MQIKHVFVDGRPVNLEAAAATAQGARRGQ
jgi:hypothetical protein